MVTRARAGVLADLEARAHRRFIKTRTPPGAIPGDPAVTDICAGRDPRGAGRPAGRPTGSTGIGAFLSQRGRAAAIGGTGPGPPRPRPGGGRDRFRPRAGGETPPTQAGSPLRRTAGHLQTFRDAAGGLDVAYVHYDDLKAGLEGQMRQMAARPGTGAGGHRWPRLAQAATSGSMRSRAGATVPGGGPGHRTDPAAFFSRGPSGQWRGLPGDAGLARYAARVRAPASGNLIERVHREPAD